MHIEIVYLGYDFHEISKILNENDRIDVKKTCIHFIVSFENNYSSGYRIIFKNIFQPEIATLQKQTRSY